MSFLAVACGEIEIALQETELYERAHQFSADASQTVLAFRELLSAVTLWDINGERRPLRS